MLGRREIVLALASVFQKQGGPKAPMGQQAPAVRSGRIPARLANGKIIVNCTIPSGTIALAIDTGATRSVWNGRGQLTSDETPQLAKGLTETVMLDTTWLPPITMGALVLPSKQVLVADLRTIEMASGATIDLVLGQDQLSSFQLEMRLYGSDPEIELFGSAPPKQPGSEIISLQPEPSGVHTIEFSTGSAKGRGLFDLGSDAALYVSADWFATHRLQPLNGTSLSASAGVEGVQVHPICTIPSLRIGGFLLERVPTILIKEWNHSYSAVVGLPVWRRFQQVLDLSTSSLQLAPAEPDSRAAFEVNRSGISALRLPGRMRIVFVAPGSPAIEAGLKAGDEIVRIDGASLDEEFFRNRPRPGAEPAGTTERLTLSTGRVQTIVLRDYY